MAAQPEETHECPTCGEDTDTKDEECEPCHERTLDHEADEMHREFSGEPAGGWLGYDDD